MKRLPYLLLSLGILSALTSCLLFLTTDQTDVARPLLMAGALLTPLAFTWLVIRFIKNQPEE
jgi:hypothetical protein